VVTISTIGIQHDILNYLHTKLQVSSKTHSKDIARGPTRTPPSQAVRFSKKPSPDRVNAFTLAQRFQIIRAVNSRTSLDTFVFFYQLASLKMSRTNDIAIQSKSL